MAAVSLSPVDYLFTGPGSQPITFAFFFPHALDAAQLRRSLKEALTLFPILQSRLQAISDREYEFRISEEGLVFETGESDADFSETAGIERYITPVDSLPGQPLTRIALIRVPKGAVLGVSISHALVDGFSYFHFLSSWARLCRGDRIIAPHLDRSGSFPPFIAVPAGESVSPETLLSDCGLFWGAPRRPRGPAGPMVVERMFIADQVIGSVLNEMQRERNVAFTRNDAIVAQLWKKYIPRWPIGSPGGIQRYRPRWIGSEGNPQTFVTCPFDFRRALAGFPRNYFGCALSFASATIAANALEKASLAELALLVKNAVGRMKNEFILKSLGTLEAFRQQRGTAAMAEIHLRHPRTGLIVTNLTRMPIRDIDFGAGPPLRFLTHVDVTGGAAILPADGGVEILVAGMSDPDRPD